MDSDIHTRSSIFTNVTEKCKERADGQACIHLAYVCVCTVQKQLSQCLCKFEKGKILSRLPEFFLILPDNNVYRPAAVSFRMTMIIHLCVCL